MSPQPGPAHSLLAPGSHGLASSLVLAAVGVLPAGQAAHPTHSSSTPPRGTAGCGRVANATEQGACANWLRGLVGVWPAH